MFVPSVDLHCIVEDEEIDGVMTDCRTTARLCPITDSITIAAAALHSKSQLPQNPERKRVKRLLKMKRVKRSTA